jgi:hypothetical protein
VRDDGYPGGSLFDRGVVGSGGGRVGLGLRVDEHAASIEEYRRISSGYIDTYFDWTTHD